jgi:O-antigen biosynthesis protein WbqV
MTRKADEGRRFRLNKRIAVVAIHDLVMAALAFEISVWLAYYFYGATQSPGHLIEGTALFIITCAVVFGRVGLYRGIWYYASLTDLTAITKAVTVAILVFVPILFVLTRLIEFPRSALLILWPLLIVMLAAPRALYRMFKDRNLAAMLEHGTDDRVPVLLAGAGDQAETFIREMSRRRLGGYRVVGIIDDKPNRIGRDIRGVRVLGDLSAVEEAVTELERQGRRPQRLIVASDKIDGAAVGRLLEVCDSLGIILARIPRLTDFKRDSAGGEVTGLDDSSIEVRPVDVEDLLGRPQKVLDRVAMANLVGGRRVLITGAGGTIGSELVRQIADLGPARIVLFDNAEYNLYRIDIEFAESHPEIDHVAILGDVRDKARVDVVMRDERPDLVFHAAAFKHVHLVEANPNEAVLTNVVGTRNVAESCREGGVETMVLISTDKAVNPTSVMGATKRVAEIFCQALGVASAGREDATRFVTVRFGNVLGSTGSVVPLFQRQLARGGPLTVTHPEVTRYFMTTREAVELVLQASALRDPKAREPGKIFVLDMGQPVRIQDLAKQMIRLAGLRPDRDVGITFTGLRPGEKLTEELFHEGEEPVPTMVEGVRLATPRLIDYELLAPQLDKLAATAESRRSDETLALIRRLVPEYEGAGEDARRAAGSE